MSIFATVTDPQKRLVPGLTQDDFSVFDNEKPQPLVYFDNSIHPINVVVMLDTSGSMTLTIDLLKQAAEQFLLRLLPEDKARVGAFNDKIQFNARWTNDRDQLITDAKNLDYGNGTRLWDAVGASLDELKGIDGRQGDPRVHRRRRHREPDAAGHGPRSRARRGSDDLRHRPREQLLQRPAQVRTKPDGGLRKIADETGGGYFELTQSERSRADLHQGRAGAAQPVRDRLHADRARQQGAQAGGEDEAAGHDGAGASKLPGCRRQDVGVWEVAVQASGLRPIVRGVRRTR